MDGHATSRRTDLHKPQQERQAFASREASTACAAVSTTILPPRRWVELQVALVLVSAEGLPAAAAAVVVVRRWGSVEV